MGNASKVLLAGTIIIIAAASGLLDGEFAAPPPAPLAPLPLLEDLSLLAEAPPGATIAYRVREGDTLRTIARRIYGDVAIAGLIRDASHQIPKTLREGQTLLLPGHPPPAVRSRPYVVREGDSLYKIAERTLGDGEGWRAIYKANRDTLKTPFHLRKGQVLRIIDDF